MSDQRARERLVEVESVRVEYPTLYCLEASQKPKFS